MAIVVMEIIFYGGYNWLMNQPDIGYAYFSPSQDGGVTASFKAEFDKVNKLQKNKYC